MFGLFDILFSVQVQKAFDSQQWNRLNIAKARELRICYRWNGWESRRWMTIGIYVRDVWWWRRRMRDRQSCLRVYFHCISHGKTHWTAAKSTTGRKVHEGYMCACGLSITEPCDSIDILPIILRQLIAIISHNTFIRFSRLPALYRSAQQKKF